MTGIYSPLAIFDCDGVLVDSELIAAAVMARVASDLGYFLTPTQCVDRFTGLSLATVKAMIEKDWGRPLPCDFEERVRSADIEAFERDLKAIEGAAWALDTLQQKGWKICVASSGRPEKIRHSLGLTELLARVEPHIFSALEVERGKPAPDLFLYAAGEMGVPPHACIVVEDAVAGIYAARAAGMIAVGFTGGGHMGPDTASRLNAAGASRIIASMPDLPAALDELWGQQRRRGS